MGTVMRSRLCDVVLDYLADHCRSAARARKVKKIAEDLNVLGVEATERSVRAALGRLRAVGYHVRITGGESAAAYLAAKPNRRREFRPPWMAQDGRRPPRTHLPPSMKARESGRFGRSSEKRGHRTPPNARGSSAATSGSPKSAAGAGAGSGFDVRRGRAAAGGRRGGRARRADRGNTPAPRSVGFRGKTARSTARRPKHAPSWLVKSADLRPSWDARGVFVRVGSVICQRTGTPFAV